MKKFMVLFVALTFLATFSFDWLRPITTAVETSPGEGSSGATGAPGPLERRAPGALEHLEHPEHRRQPQKKNDRGISGYIFAKRIYPSMQGCMTPGKVY